MRSTGGSARRAPGAASLSDLLAGHPFGDGAELICTRDSALSAGDARAAAATWADRLRSAGIEKGHAVVVQLARGPEAVVAMMGTWAAGAVYVPVDARQPRAELDRAAGAAGASAVLDETGLHPREGRSRRYGEDIAFVTWTSGTTGAPRAILHTHSGYVELLDRVLGPLSARRADPGKVPVPNLVPVPLSLNAGIYNVLFGLRAGAAVVLMDRFTTGELAELVRRYSIRSTVLPPAAIVMLTDDRSVGDLSPLRYVRSITAPLSPLAARRFTERFGVTVLNGYGQAEVGEVAGWSAADAREHPEKLGAVGRAHRGVDLRVEADGGGLAGVDEVGELLVRSPRMAAGYASGETMADRLDADGFLRTGDFARIDADGFVWIEGRVSEVINRGGNKVFPGQVEEVILLAPGVREAAVVGAPDSRLGEVPVAFIVGEGDDRELVDLCREHLSPYKVPVAFRRVDTLPRSEIGKVLRRELLALL